MDKVKDLQQKQNPVLHTFFSEILRSLAFLQKKTEQEFIEHIYLTGDGIRKESLLPYLRTRLNIPVVRIAPQLSPEIHDISVFGEFFATIGTAFQDTEAFNILPASYHKANLLRKINQLLLLIIAVTFIGMGDFSFLQERVIGKQRLEIRKQEREYEKLNPIQGVYNKFRNQINDIYKENQELKSSIPDAPPLIQILKLLSNEVPKEIRLDEINFYKYIDKNEDKQKNSNGPQKPTYYLDISGHIKNDLIIGDVIIIDFINQLNDLNFFKKIELLNKNKKPSESLTSFELRTIL